MSDEHLGFNFWTAMRFIQGVITKDYFLEVMAHRKKLLTEFIASRINMKDKIEREHEPIPFYGKIMIETSRKHHELELETIEKMIEQSQLPENQNVFLQEDDE